MEPISSYLSYKLPGQPPFLCVCCYCFSLPFPRRQQHSVQSPRPSPIPSPPSAAFIVHIHSSVCLLGLSLVLLLLQCQSVIISTKGSLQFIIIMWTPSCQRQRLNANVSPPPPQFLCCSRYWIYFSRPTTSLKTKGDHYFYRAIIIPPSRWTQTRVGEED